MLDSDDVTRLDGRAARSQRTRAAIVDGLIALLEEGDVQPTVEAIATRAGVAPRTVFQHYPDREALFAAVGLRRQARIDALMTPPVATTGSVEDRVDALVRQRSGVYECIAPVRHAALLMEPFSPSVRAVLDGFRALKRADAERIFAAELGAAAPEARAATVAALGAATSFAAWDALRVHQGLSTDQAEAAVRRIVRALLHAG